MVEIIVAIALEVAKCLAPCAERQINYLRKYETNFENLKTEMEKLRDKSRSIQREVDAARKKGEDIAESVQKWLEKVKELEENFQKCKLERASRIIHDDEAVGKIRKGEETEAAVAAGEIGGDGKTAEVVGEMGGNVATSAAAKKKCFKGLCPDLKMRYQLSKEAVVQLDAVVKHLKDATFDKIYYPVVSKDLRLLNKDFRAFESRTSTLKNLINSLSDQNVNMVGIYGMGGIGKTTLAKEVAKQAKENKLFDLVIFVEVKQIPDKMKIQQEIAGKLDLKFSEEEDELTRAGKLYERLENEKKVLIILDNIWAQLDLQQAIGIPLGSAHNGCKVLLTARSGDVLMKMDSQRNFQVKLLDDEEAWQLFKNMSGDNIKSSEFESVAREIAKKCARLPIVVVTVARALKSKQLFAWKDALRKLNIEDIHASIRLSFDYLETKDLRTTILVIRFANLTSVDELLMYGMGLGLFEGIDEMEARRNRVLTLVQELKDSCLLLDSNTNGNDFSMHDVVRDVAMSIASEVWHVFTNESFNKLQLPDENTLKNCDSIVLKDVGKGELPQVLECQQLNLLSLSGTFSFLGYLLKIPSISFSSGLHDQFFARMTKLKVLVLAYVNLEPLPRSLHCLTNLQALGLYDCLLDDIAIIGDLKKLEVLSFKRSPIKRLPVEVGHLTRLKSLDMGDSYWLPSSVIAPNVISRLSHLEELYMGKFRGWEEEVLNKDRKNVSVDELKHLCNLTCLEIQIQDAKTIPRDLSFKNLERYKIEIGSERSSYRKGIPKICRKLTLSLINTNICLKDGHIMQLKGIEDLCLVGSQDMESIVFGLDRDGFPQLRYLEVRDNENLLSFVGSTECVTCTVFPVLESLSICRLINLEKVCNQLTTELSFSQLREVKVNGCVKLENIFSFSIARRLKLLQSIDVDECQNMKEIFAIEREDKSSSNISEAIDIIELSQLRSLRLYSLPQLRSLEYNSNVSNTLFTGKVALPNLEVLELNKINVEMIWLNTDAAISSGIQNLTGLILSYCNNLRCLFSSSMIKSFVQLQKLLIRNCPVLEEIMIIEDEDRWIEEEKKNNILQEMLYDNIIHDNEKITKRKGNMITELVTADKGDEAKDHEIVFRELKELYLDDLESLTSFCSANYILKFPSLEELTVINCPKMKRFSGGKSMVQLRKMKIKRCNMITELVTADKGDESKDHEIVFRELKELYVDDLESLTSFCSANYILKLPSLEGLTVIDCPKMKSFSGGKSMVQLRKMNITRCNMITELVTAGKGDEAKDYEIVFWELKELHLYDLESLTSFCSANYTLKFPSLQELSVSCCPKMKSFSEGKLITPKLQKVNHWRDRKLEECWMGDLNTTIQELYEETYERSGPIMIELTNEEEEE